MAAAMHFLCLSLAIFPFFAAASPWIVTEHYEEVVTVEPAYTDRYDDYTEPARTYTELYTVTAPSGPAISTATVTRTDDSYYENGDPYTIIQLLHPYNAADVATTTIDYYASGRATSTGYIYTNYVVNIAYSAPTSCSSSWVYTTAVPVSPPYEIENALVPTSVSTSYYVENGRPFQASTITEEYLFIDPTQVPAASLSSLSSVYGPYPTSSCSDPNSSDESSGTSSSSSSSATYVPSSDDSCYYYYYYCSYSQWINDPYPLGISPLAIILISVLGWSAVIFVAGLFENYFHFQRLMKGWQARRGLPLTWWFWIFPVTCLICLGFSRRGFQARSVEDAAELRNKWEEMSFWKKKQLWLRYGFTFGYPSMLGPAPPRVGRPSPEPLPTQPLLQVSPPPSENGAVSRQPSTTGEGDRDVDVEAAATAAAPSARTTPEMSMSGGLPAAQSLQVPSRAAAPQVTNRPTPAVPEEEEISEVAAPAEERAVAEKHAEEVEKREP